MQDRLLELRARGVVFRVCVVDGPLGSCPPYLYGERAPREVLVFDEGTFGMEKTGKELTGEDLISFKYGTKQQAAVARPSIARTYFVLPE